MFDEIGSAGLGINVFLRQQRRARDRNGRSGKALTRFYRRERSLLKIESFEFAKLVEFLRYSSESRVMPASPTAEQDSTETFTLRSDKRQALLHSSVWSYKLNGVSWADLTNIEYADGTTWHASSTARCHAVPSRTLLVADLQ
jgi:hypothetical protein